MLGVMTAQMFLGVGVQHGSKCHIRLGRHNNYPVVSGSDCHDYPVVSGSDCHIRLGRHNDYPVISGSD